MTKLISRIIRLYPDEDKMLRTLAKKERLSLAGMMRRLIRAAHKPENST